MAYFLLIRRISPYSGADILLGVFDTEDAAQDALRSYRGRYDQRNQELETDHWLSRLFRRFRNHTDTNFNPDPWHTQACKPDGIADDDLIIRTFELVGSPSFNEISVVSAYYDSMGQIMRDIDSIHPNRMVAEQRMAELESVAEEADVNVSMPPNRFDTQTIRINAVQSDSPEDQPVR
jgi:hypothetical protein